MRHQFLSKPRKRRKCPEYIFHCHVADALDKILDPELTCWSSIENSNHTGGTSGKIKQSKDKRKGVKAGVPDVFILYSGTCLWIELKAGYNGTSEPQDLFHKKIRKAGSIVVVVRTIDELMTILEQYEVPTLIKE